jgi:hypothetical protein
MSLSILIGIFLCILLLVLAIVCIIATIYTISYLSKDNKITETKTESSGIIINGVDQKKETYNIDRPVTYGIIGELTGKKDDLIILDIFVPIITGIFAFVFMALFIVKYKNTMGDYKQEASQVHQS